MKTDSLFYRLFQAMPSLALELAGITVTERAAYAFRSEEIKQTGVSTGRGFGASGGGPGGAGGVRRGAISAR
jgi:hypothetical protein